MRKNKGITFGNKNEIAQNTWKEINMRIMVCYDGSDAAKRALKLALELSKAFNGHILAVVALEGDTQEQLSVLEMAEQAVEYARVFLSDEAVSCETKLLSANSLSAGENLVSFAKENQADEIIVGIKKTSKVGKFFTGSTAQYIILNAPCPVLTTR